MFLLFGHPLLTKTPISPFCSLSLYFLLLLLYPFHPSVSSLLSLLPSSLVPFSSFLSYLTCATFASFKRAFLPSISPSNILSLAIRVVFPSLSPIQSAYAPALARAIAMRRVLSPLIPAPCSDNVISSVSTYSYHTRRSRILREQMYMITSQQVRYCRRYKNLLRPPWTKVDSERAA